MSKDIYGLWKRSSVAKFLRRHATLGSKYIGGHSESVDVDRDDESVGDIDDTALGDVEAEQFEGDGGLWNGGGPVNHVNIICQCRANSSGGRINTVTNALPHPRRYKPVVYMKTEMLVSYYNKNIRR